MKSSWSNGPGITRAPASPELTSGFGMPAGVGRLSMASALRRQREGIRPDPGRGPRQATCPEPPGHPRRHLGGRHQRGIDAIALALAGSTGHLVERVVAEIRKL